METITPLVEFSHLAKFRQLVEALQGARILNTIELSRCKIIQFIITCKSDQVKVIEDYAFHSFLTNPEFKKYY